MTVDLGHSTGATVNVTHNHYSQLAVNVSISEVVQRLIDHVEWTLPESPEKRTLVDRLKAAASDAVGIATKIPDLVKLFNAVGGAAAGSPGTDIIGV